MKHIHLSREKLIKQLQTSPINNWKILLSNNERLIDKELVVTICRHHPEAYEILLGCSLQLQSILRKPDVLQVAIANKPEIFLKLKSREQLSCYKKTIEIVENKIKNGKNTDLIIKYEQLLKNIEKQYNEAKNMRLFQSKINKPNNINRNNKAIQSIQDNKEGISTMPDEEKASDSNKEIHSADKQNESTDVSLSTEEKDKKEENAVSNESPNNNHTVSNELKDGFESLKKSFNQLENELELKEIKKMIKESLDAMLIQSKEVIQLETEKQLKPLLESTNKHIQILEQLNNHLINPQKELENYRKEVAELGKILTKDIQEVSEQFSSEEKIVSQINANLKPLFTQMKKALDHELTQVINHNIWDLAIKIAIVSFPILIIMNMLLLWKAVN